MRFPVAAAARVLRSGDPAERIRATRELMLEGVAEPAQAVPPLVAALEAKLAREQGVVIGADRRVVVTAGGNMAFANAVLFAAYIVLAHRAARHGAVGGIDGLAGAMLVAAVVVTPLECQSKPSTQPKA